MDSGKYEQPQLTPLTRAAGIAYGGCAVGSFYACNKGTDMLCAGGPAEYSADFCQQGTAADGGCSTGTTQFMIYCQDGGSPDWCSSGTGY